MTKFADNPPICMNCQYRLTVWSVPNQTAKDYLCSYYTLTAKKHIVSGELVPVKPISCSKERSVWRSLLKRIFTNSTTCGYDGEHFKKYEGKVK